MRETVPSEPKSVSLVEGQGSKAKSSAVVYKRIRTADEAEQISREREKPVGQPARPASSEADQEKVRLRRLLEMNLISREEYARRTGETR